MDAPSRRIFLGLAANAMAAAAIGATALRLIDAAEAMPLDPSLARAGSPPDRAIPAQWGPPGPGWGGPGWGPGWGPRPRRRRWVCWWHRGRRRCGWRW